MSNVDFVGTPLFLRAALQVTLATMHVHITQAGLFLGTIFRIQVISGNSLASMKNCPRGQGTVN